MNVSGIFGGSNERKPEEYDRRNAVEDRLGLLAREKLKAQTILDSLTAQDSPIQEASVEEDSFYRPEVKSRAAEELDKIRGSIKDVYNDIGDAA